jgi:7-keto-8-aminopelargonate synthetase-like enzyme
MQPTPFKFAGNDYLGLATHPAVIEALRSAAEEYGVSATSSRWAQGWTDLHERLEREITGWMGSEDACIFAAAYLGGAVYYGYMASAGRRVVFCDEMVHSSQLLGMRAAGLEIRTFRHLDVADLRRVTAGYAGPPAIVASDGVYGISGEVAPVKDLAEVAERIGAELFIDDAHGVGVLGRRGRGSTELAGVSPERATILGSMSKAMGASGGFLAGRREIVDACRRGPEVSGSTPLPAPLVGAALAALGIIRTDPEPRRRMEENGARMRAALRGQGIALADDRHPILGMLLADEAHARALEGRFRAHGLWIPYFKYASEPRSNLLRAAARAVYTDELLERFERALSA